MRRTSEARNGMREEGPDLRRHHPDDPSERSVDALERFFIQHAPLIR
jgi:hypothetical protein